MHDFERAALAEVALKSIPPDDAMSAARDALCAAGPPWPAFLDGMTDARSWAGRTTRAGLKAFALSSFNAMNAVDRAAFRDHVSR